MNTQNLMTRNAADGVASKSVMRLAEMAKKPQQREASLGTVDLEARTVELSFSSEIEYQRWFGMEVLGHAPGEVRMARLQNGAAALWNHNWDDQRGKVETARIDADGKGRAVIRFSKSEAGEQLMRDVDDGIITKISVGYMIHGLKLVEERNDVDVYRVTDWEPYEISFVSVPADDTVGVGRNLEIPPEEPKAKQVETATSDKNSAATRSITKDYQSMNFRTYRDAQGNLCRVAINADGQDVGAVEIIEKAGAERSAGVDSERTRAAAILELGERYSGSIPNARELASQHVRENRSSQEFQDALLEAFNKRTAAPLSEQGRSAELGLDGKDLKRYSFLNVARALANPNDKAAMRAAAFEMECSHETGFTLGQISMSPKTIAAYTDITRRLMQQTSGDAERMVRADLLLSMAMGIDRAALYGTGTEFQPKGLKFQSGLNAVPFGTAGKPTFAELVQMETEVAADNADIGSLAYLGNARFRGYCKTATKFGAGTDATIWEPGSTVNGYRTEITNQVANNDLFYGNFADFVIAMWAGLDLTVDTAALALSGGTRLIAFQDVDMGLRRQESICLGG